jgi:hypothetical protein
VSEDALKDEPDELTATLLGSNLCTLFRKTHLNEQIKIGSRHFVCSFWCSSGGVLVEFGDCGAAWWSAGICRVIRLMKIPEG